MIINHPFVNRFSPSVKEVVPQTGDDAFVIRPILNLAALPPEPIFRILSNAGVIVESSFIVEQGIQMLNGAGISITAVIIRPGYWELDFNIGYRANYQGTISTGDARVTLDTGSGATTILTLFAAIGAQQANRKMSLMIRDQATIVFIMSLNGVGNDQAAVYTVAGNKLL